MRSFSSAIRNEYLSGDVTPTVRATLRRLRLDFGSTLYHDNDGHVIDGVHYQGDDYNDVPGGYRVVWGDSCISSVSPHSKVRLICKAAWTQGGSSTWYVSRTTGSGWSLSAISASNPTVGQYVRIGIYPAGGVADSSESFWVWYIDDLGDLYRKKLTYTIGTAAIHPVSASEAILVAYNDPYLWVKYLYYDGDWDGVSSDWVVHMSDDLIFSDAHWSDAVVSPDDSNKIVVAVNLTKWGSAHAITYDKQSGYQ